MAALLDVSTRMRNFFFNSSPSSNCKIIETIILVFPVPKNSKNIQIQIQFQIYSIEMETRELIEPGGPSISDTFGIPFKHLL